MTPRYTPAVQHKVLTHYAKSHSARRTAAEFDVHYQTVYRWAAEERQKAKPLRWRCCNFLQDARFDCAVCGAKAPIVQM